VPAFNQHQSPRHADWVRRVFGEDLELSTLSPEIQAAIILELDRIEFHATYGQRDWCSVRLAQAADATHMAQIEVFNPLGSNIITVITGALFEAAPGSQGFLILDGTASAGGTSQVIGLDTRLTGRGNTVVSGAKPDLAIGGQQVIDATITTGSGGNGESTFELFRNPNFRGVLLAPNHRLKMEASSVNVNIAGTFWGYERVARPEELAFVG
jgi:hypothetical protein